MVIYALFYIYRSAKFGEVVFKASMLDWPGGSNLPWVYVHCSIYRERSAKFVVVVFKASMLD